METVLSLSDGPTIRPWLIRGNELMAMGSYENLQPIVGSEGESCCACFQNLDVFHYWDGVETIRCNAWTSGAWSDRCTFSGYKKGAWVAVDLHNSQHKSHTHTHPGLIHWNPNRWEDSGGERGVEIWSEVGVEGEEGDDEKCKSWQKRVSIRSQIVYRVYDLLVRVLTTFLSASLYPLSFSLYTPGWIFFSFLVSKFS